MNVIDQITFLDKFFQDVRDFDAIIFRVGKMGLEIFLCQSCKIKLQNKRWRCWQPISPSRGIQFWYQRCQGRWCDCPWRWLLCMFCPPCLVWVDRQPWYRWLLCGVRRVHPCTVWRGCCRCLQHVSILHMEFSGALAEADKLVWLVLVPVLLEPVVAAELAMLNRFPWLRVVDGKGPLGYERIW